jgi:NADPH-dependent glutamate synthase beta subunit-like oxidoreductase
LTAAFYLRKKGRAVTILDSNAKPGGALRYVIPKYMLPEAVLEREIEEIFSVGVDFGAGSQGVEFVPNIRVGEDVSLSQLRNDYDAVFMATGAPLSRKIEIEGAGAGQVLWGMDFLKDVTESKPAILEGNVVVIGRGAQAVHVALTARRLGASEVHIVRPEEPNEKPAHEWYIKFAEEE